ncbi:glycosyltransferase family 4 protein [Thiobaca trueperi]|uniref:Colanic acid biosynthesis glycosyl transferase WcaI n=1 Tax=Thiobaca trueperi TaxID=127458 RepID=A0A4R3MRY5_9GAMM|nr:glycosyltransferase family 4 protein [Thiobaca trueperi]TCT18695.1 colanic acid biosynthesis glycosyl transferase WcaI [Thiobaca trueperi]
MHTEEPPKHIVIVSLLYWPEKTGSAPPVQQTAEILAHSGYRVTVLTARPSYPECVVFPAYRDGSRDIEQHQGVSIVRFAVAPQHPGGGALSRLKTELPFALRAWWSLLRRPCPDAVIAVCPSILAVGAMLLSVSSRVQRLAVMHDLQSGLARSLGIVRQGLTIRLLEGLERLILNRVQRIVTLSDAMADAIRAIGVTAPIDIIPPTVDDDLIQPQPENPGPITLLYSGNIGRKQGLEQLIDLAGHLQQRQLDAMLIIRGDGNYREELQRLAQERALNNLRFEPLLPVDQLSAGLAQGHIHLVPQNPAGAAFAVPSKIYSIMAAGRTFVCTAEVDSPLDRLRVESDAFVICPPNRAEALAEVVERLMADPGERARLGRNGRAYVERCAGRSAAARAYRTLVDEALPAHVNGTEPESA